MGYISVPARQGSTTHAGASMREAWVAGTPAKPLQREVAQDSNRERKERSMKRFASLFVLCLISTSCAWTYNLNSLMGKRFEFQSLRDLKEVAFYEGPSLNSASFYLEEPEKFTTITFTCPEEKSSCDMRILIDPYSGFFK